MATPVLDRPVVLIDDLAERTSGSFVLPAASATADAVAFVVRHSSGVLEVPLDSATCDRLRLPPMPGSRPGADGRPAYTVSVDASDGIGTGISATDRARTARLLGSPSTRPEQLSRPGHVLPVRVCNADRLTRFGVAEASVALAREAGHPGAALTAVATTADGQGLAGARELAGLAHGHGLRTALLSELLAAERERVRRVEAVVETRLPTAHGDFRAIGLRSLPDGAEHLALISGDIAGSAAAGRTVRYAVHAECTLGDVFGSATCGCRARLDAALATVAREPAAVLVYVRTPDDEVGVTLSCPDAPPPGLVGGILGAIGLPAGLAIPVRP